MSGTCICLELRLPPTGGTELPAFGRIHAEAGTSRAAPLGATDNSTCTVGAVLCGSVILPLTPPPPTQEGGAHAGHSNHCFDWFSFTFGKFKPH